MNTQASERLKVFLCYAPSDKAVVKKLYDLLSHDGMDVWLDSEKLLPGQEWQHETLKAVRLADAIIVCISNKSLNHEGYLQKEIKLALDVADEKPEGIIFLIPARLEGCPIPERLKHLQWVDLFVEGGYERLLMSLQARASHGNLKFQQDHGANISIMPPSLQDSNEMRGLQRELVNLLRDPNRFSLSDLCLYWQDYIDPTVDWGWMMRTGKSQVELAGELVAKATRQGDLKNLAKKILPHNRLNLTAASQGSIQKEFVLDPDKDFVSISPGSFWMGSKDDQSMEPAETPQHELRIPYEFKIARCPVTNFQFSEFLKQTGNNHYSLSVLARPDHPVTNVTWYDAVEYCKWLTRTFKDLLEQGYAFRLPSEAEWEMAARGVLPSKRKYPWGNGWATPELSFCNSLEEGLGSTTPVGIYSPHGDSLYKIADMAGNVREWTRSAWGEVYEYAKYKYPYSFRDEREDFGLPQSVLRVARGGSFSDSKEMVTCSRRYRQFPFERLENVGFRVAITLIGNWTPKKFDEKKVVPNLLNEFAKSFPLSKRK